MFKTFSLIDENSKFLGIYIAQESPREPGVFIAPENAVEGEPTIPAAEGKNRYWIDNDWVYVNIVQPEPEPPVELSLPEQFELVRLALQAAIDDHARDLGFSGGNALMLYATFENPYQPIALPFAQWEASVWFEANAYKAQVLAETAPMVTPEQAVSMMPVLVMES